MTSGVQAQLVEAAAELNRIPASQYTGLRPGSTYYAYDPATATYWAGGALVPRTASSAGGISVMDDGSYDLFRRAAHGSWQAYDVGLAGVGGTPCPVQVPEDVLRLWGWPSGTCQQPR